MKIWDPSRNEYTTWWDPSRNEYTTWDGREVTPDGGIHRRVTPRLVGYAADKFKAMWGVCTVVGCCKIAGHDSAHTVQS